MSARTRTGASPDAIYRAGEDAAGIEESVWQSRGRTLASARLVAFAALGITGWLAFGTHAIARPWILLPIALFVALVIAHDRVLSRAERASRVKRFHAEGLARVEDRWAGQGDSGTRYLEAQHPYAQDLDVFGKGSLFELLATTRTATGSDRLAAWLLEGTEPGALRRRHVAVQELIPRLDMRLAMAIAGDEASTTDAGAAFEKWATQPLAKLSRAVAWVAVASTLLSLGGLSLWLFSGAGPVPFGLALVLQGLLGLALRGRVRPILATAETPVGSLARNAALLSTIERERFEAPLLVELRDALEMTGRPPSAEFEALRRLIDRRDVRQNQFFAPIAGLLMWGTHTALALQSWRERCGPRIGDWIAAAGEIEALCALAGYAFEHPEDPFPEIVEEGALFDGRGLAHPLLPATLAIRNDLELGQRPQALVMSGSNMSGKSTMLRTVGCNTILALAGAPVRARSLRLSPLRIAASIRIVDSLQEGQSHFMAEILRLRQVVEVAREAPTALFLLDEILHGTNSHDRRIGAQAVIESLVEMGALGIVTTHDLALTQIVSESDGRLANVHFEDHLEDDRMEFDYSLRDGVVRKSNALELMRSVGLDV